VTGVATIAAFIEARPVHASAERASRGSSSDRGLSRHEDQLTALGTPLLQEAAQVFAPEAEPVANSSLP
jgi:hypothetical protein